MAPRPVARSAFPAVALATALVVAALGGCRCGPGVNEVETRFRVAPESQSLDFGRQLEGTVVTKPVTLIAETRAAVSVGAATKAPFSVAPLVDIPGGSQVDVDVTFVAGNGESNDELVLTSGRQELRVGLRGVGVRPPTCVPSAVCRTSMYSLELDRCVEAQSPDDSECEPSSLCLEQGRCRAGECLGVARRCNDNDLCTSDACSMDAGCIHTRVACPAPSNPCHVATCDARTGCGEALALDGTPCGPSNCVATSLCVNGECMEVPTPDGTECAPSIACFGASTCKDKKCVRPDAGEWLPTWTARVEGAPSVEPPALLAGPGGVLFFTVCGLPLLPDDGGLRDGGLDAGSADAGPFDGGADAGLDGGDDAGAPLDAGPPTECALVSFTSTGFERFTARTGALERLSLVGPAGVVTRLDGGLAFRTRAMGAFVGGWETGPLRAEQVAMLRDGGVVVAVRVDGGADLVMTSPSMATVLQRLTQPVLSLAVGLDDSVYALTGNEVVRVTPLGVSGSAAVTGPHAVLAVADDVVVARDQLLRVGNGGFTAPVGLVAPPDAGSIARHLLVTPSTVFRFFEGCVVQAMSCLPEDRVGWVRAFSRSTGAVLWEDRLLPEGTRSRLVEATSLRVPGGTEAGLAAIVEGEVDGGVINGLVVTLDGGRALECQFPAGTGRLAASLFTPGQLVTLAERPDGGVTLQAWTLGPLPLESSGWVSPEGASGQRRPAP